MALVYIQQNSKTGENIPYSNKYYPQATIASGGCGCCSSLMVLLNSTSYSMTLEKWANILIKNKARESSGTDMNVVADIMEEKYGFQTTNTSSIDLLKKHVKAGNKAVALVGNKGYFSTSGHFVCIAGITKDGKAIVLDPYCYSTKWTATYKGISRSKYFKYDTSTHEVICDFSVISKDAKGSKPFYLFVPTKKVKNRYSTKDVNYKTTTSKKATKQTGWVGTVTASSLNVRANANISSKVIGSLKKGAKVKVYGSSGDYYSIKYKNKTAYVAKKYIKK